MCQANTKARPIVISVRFKEDPDRVFQRAIGRFEQVDARWRSILELASCCLSDRGRGAFGASLDGLDVGPAPRLLPFAIDPDAENAIGREAAHMPHAALMSLGLLIPGILGFGHPEIAVVQGLITAVHRLLRIAKARP